MANEEKIQEKLVIDNFFCPFCGSNAKDIVVKIIKNNRFKFHCYNCCSTIYLPEHPKKNRLDKNFHYIQQIYNENPYKLANLSRHKKVWLVQKNVYPHYLCLSCNRKMTRNPPSAKKPTKNGYYFFKCDDLKVCKTHGYVAPKQNFLAFWRFLSRASVLGKAQEGKGLR